MLEEQHENWRHDQQKSNQLLEQKIEEEEDEAAKQKPRGQLEQRQVWLLLLDNETNDLKKANWQAGLEYFGQLLMQKVEDGTDEETKKKLEKRLQVEYLRLQAITSATLSVLVRSSCCINNKMISDSTN